MRHARHSLLAVVAALAVGGCGRESTGPWLTDPGVAGHARYFPIAGTPHDPSAAGAVVRCESCHPGTTFAQFTCTTACHAKPATDATHASVTGYVYADASCYGCHKSGVGAMPADHDTRLFPRGAGSAHAAVGCTQCHADFGGNVAAFRCGGCHLSLDPALVTRHTSTPSNPAILVSASEIDTGDGGTCLRCHADAQVTRTASHPTGSQGDPPHQGARCLQCHDLHRTDKPFAADFATDPAAQANFTSSPRRGCYECHDSYPPRGD